MGSRVVVEQELGFGLTMCGGVLLIQMRDVSKVSDKTANHARCRLVWAGGTEEGDVYN